ncbi:hypothetical protein VNO80_22762 [Phaseolus coccineus]|uniref:Uncharacterized protein n=1 Tax=Phaseolus coccineus TaxID=3886 RepID=A0AAN9QUC6_PHACN
MIPPLLGVGGGRYYVKPASRCVFHPKSQETYAFTKVPRLNSQLRVSIPTYCRHNLAQQTSRVRAGITQMLAPKSAKADVRVYEVRMKDAASASSVAAAEFSWKV